LTDEIQHLQDHLDAHGKDYDAKRALLKKVAKRRSLLKYLKSSDLEVYASIAQQFKLKA
jgi:small subunit ribosomal protein S15